jgi:hypothetical protein
MSELNKSSIEITKSNKQNDRKMQEGSQKSKKSNKHLP